MKDFWRGYYMTSGAACCLAVIYLFGSAFGWISSKLWPDPMDNSDTSLAKRSGFVIRTDALTGCQYLDGEHGVIPRTGTDGRQICGVKP